MKKSTLPSLKFTAITVISALICICVVCADNSTNERSPNNNGEVDRFLGVKYKVMFDGNGGTVDPSSDTTGADGTLSSLPTPTRSGYTFDGWYTAVTGGTQVTAGYVFSNSTTIYAKWTEESVTQPTAYTITFDANGGSGSVSALNVPSGSSVTLPDGRGLSRSGYTFGGWNTKSDGTGTNYNAGSSYTPAGDVTLYAEWTSSGGGGGGSTFTDSRDNNTYKKVVIGTQVWMGENLNYDVQGSVCYDNDPSNCEIYGRLYDWSMAMNGEPSSSASPSEVRGVCPIGWHLPSHFEWDILVDYVGGWSTAGTKLKSSSYWDSYSGVPNGTDEYGFSALPGGNGYGGNFSGVYKGGLWWSATESNTDRAWYRIMYNSSENVAGDPIGGKSNQFSVRCVQDGAGGALLPAVTDFVDKRDNRNYKKVRIGNQTWMAENLNYDVPNNTSDVCYKYSADSCRKYGRLYDWSTTMTACPVGWHLPLDEEWTMLVNAAGGSSTAGTKLKSTSGWADNGNGTDTYGFSALPGGIESDGSFLSAPFGGYWWSDASSASSFQPSWRMTYSNIGVSREIASTKYRFSVRCVEDEGGGVPIPTYTITFDANGGSGSVSARSVPVGSSVTLPSGSGLSMNGYRFGGWNTKSDGTGTNYSVDSSYTPTGDVTLYAKYCGTNFKTVRIGTQTWMAENLNCDIEGSVCNANAPAICAKYGRLYNWHTALTACPAGWHLPSDAEWTTLENYVGGSSIAGTMLKSSTGWNSSYSGVPAGTDAYGFSALPGGISFSSPLLPDIGIDEAGYWWSDTEDDADRAWYRNMYFARENVIRNSGSKTTRYSVRCVAD